MSGDFQRIRYHEAGHAVIGVLGGFHLYCIVADPDSRSDPKTLLMWQTPRDDDPLRDQEVRHRVHQWICSRLAGELAAAKGTRGEPVPQYCRSDHDEARKWIRRLTATPGCEPTFSDLESYLARATAEVYERLNVPLTWEHVEALVTELEGTPRLDHRASESFFRRRHIHMPPRPSAS